MNAEEHIRTGRLVAIVRVPQLTAESAAAITAVLVDAGIRALEFTLTSNGALDAVSAAVSQANGRAAVGAGTVMSEEQVAQVADAGAQFVVSPHVSPAVIARSLDLGLVPLPGAFTATEVQLAVTSGAPLVKLFPAQPAGVAYLNSLRGPLQDVSFVPTGGVEISDIATFLSSGAVAVALGSALVRSSTDLEGLGRRAEAAVRAATSVA